MKIYRNIGELLTLEGAAKKQGRKIVESDLSLVEDAAMIVSDGVVQWAGAQKKLPRKLENGQSTADADEVNVGGRTVLPGFVDCHTHTVFAGSRADEFEMRNAGATYQEISARGGGILSTVKKTREASESELLLLAEKRLRDFVKQGVTTVEVKTGYGLSLQDELKCLRVISRMKGISVVSTFLGAHAKPPEFQTHSDYLKHLSTVVLPEVVRLKLAERIDIFIEKGFFEHESAQEFLRDAQKLGMKITIHADQLTLSGGTDAALELGALSADHVIQIDESRIQKMAKSETTAVLLPIADFYLKCAYPPARKLIEAGARVALATDFNPGTAPSQNINFAGVLARLEMKMSLPEVIAAFTVGGALALQKPVGNLTAGSAADFAIFDCEWSELFYSVGSHPVTEVISGGKTAYRHASKFLKES